MIEKTNLETENKDKSSDNKNDKKINALIISGVILFIIIMVFAIFSEDKSHSNYSSNKTRTTSPGAFYDENGNGKIDNGELAIGHDDVYVYADGDYYEWG